VADATATDTGEFALIARVVARLGTGPQVLLGPGDDAAVVAAPDGRVVATTDLLVEGVHFRRDWSSGYDVGRKAAAANLADVMAMGATGTALLVGLSAPPDLPVAWALALADGLRDEGALVGAVVVGGDTTSGERVVVAVTALGDLDGLPP
jgi:thiamine-monophosphate kinase